MSKPSHPSYDPEVKSPPVLSRLPSLNPKLIPADSIEEADVFLADSSPVDL